MLSGADHERLHAAIAAAEAKTSGELFCVVARESGSYREVPLAWAAGVALVAPPLALALGVRPYAVIALLQNGWVAAQGGASHGLVMTSLILYAAAQALLFAIVGGLALYPPIRRALTPRAIRRQHVHARAMEQFAHRLHATDADTGVLIYASLAERQVEIIADEAIHKKVAQGVWDQAVAAAVGPMKAGDAAGGLVAAIEACGRALAEHFPRESLAPIGAGDPVSEV